MFWHEKYFPKLEKSDLGVAREFFWLEMCSVEMSRMEQLKSARRGRRGARV